MRGFKRNTSIATLLSFLFLSAGSLSAQLNLADVIEESEKSVVRIEVKGKDGGGLGSGYIVSKDGKLVTNVHVLAGAERAVAIFPNGDKYEIVGTLFIDEGRDICVAKIKLADAIPIKLAADLPRKGETVTALGAPMGLSFTATTGIISAIRPGDELGRDIGDTSMKGTWIQVDAALSPGNSGGPLINKKGEVVAMSTRASQGAAQNLNFGISIKDIRMGIKKAEDASLTKLPDGVGKIKMHDIGGGGESSPDSIISKKEVPASSLQNYIKLGDESFKDLSSAIRREAKKVDRDYREMRSGKIGFPGNYNGDAEYVVMSGRTKKTYFFARESTKKRIVGRKEARRNKLKELKETLKEADHETALHALLQNAGPALDPREPNSVGFINGAVVMHAYNDHDIMVSYDGAPFLMWVESSSGLSVGQELTAMPAYVAGTETVAVPGKSTMSVTVLQAITDRELEKAVIGNYPVWNDKSGKHSVEAKLVENDGTHVHLKKKDGSIVKVPLSILDEDSLKAAKAAK